MMKIYIDSNVFVSYVKRDEGQNHKDSKSFLEFILRNNFEDVTFFTSRFTEVEVGSAVYRRSKQQNQARATLHRLTRAWANKIFPLPENPSEKIKIDNLIVKLVETALNYGTTFGDTIHANDVESYDVDYLVTWNLRDFKKLEKKIKKVKVLTPTGMREILEMGKRNKLKQSAIGKIK